jgi:hypothetical protein
MPLLDHFHPPLIPRRHWESFHNFWITQLAGRLNMRPLPSRFIAEGEVHIGLNVVVDVATFENDQPAGDSPNGPVAVAVWAPPKPQIVAPVDFATLQTFELRIYDFESARRLVAAVELVSPGNKDRPETRRAFLDKCATYLREGVSLSIVDVVTSRQHNFHAELMGLLKVEDAASPAATSDLYATAYRVHLVGKRTELELWPNALAVGQPLPTLPLWLTESFCVPLELEPAYQMACRYAGIG